MHVYKYYDLCRVYSSMVCFAVNDFHLWLPPSPPKLTKSVRDGKDPGSTCGRIKLHALITFKDNKTVI